MLGALGIVGFAVAGLVVVAHHYPLFRRDIPAGQVTDVRVDHGDLVILTADGGKAKPPTLRAPVVGGLSGSRAARSARSQILDYVQLARENGSRPGPRRIVKLQPWALVIPLTVLFAEAFLTR